MEKGLTLINYAEIHCFIIFVGTIIDTFILHCKNLSGAFFYQRNFVKSAEYFWDASGKLRRKRQREDNETKRKKGIG